jgi:hypothetical protein
MNSCVVWLYSESAVLSMLPHFVTSSNITASMMQITLIESTSAHTAPPRGVQEGWNAGRDYGFEREAIVTCFVIHKASSRCRKEVQKQ